MTRASAFVLGLLSVFALLAVNTGANAPDPQYCDDYATNIFNPGLSAMKGEINTRDAMLAQQC